MAGWDARLTGLFAAAALLLAVPLSEGADKAPSSQEQQVTVQAHRLKLERRVRDFVSEITLGGSETSLQRWTEPLCPQVAGLTAAQGEGVLTRLSQIARKAGAPLGPEQCTPNLVIVVTPDPEALIQAWRSQTQGRIFNGAAPMTIRRFMQKDRPVRVWYNTQITDLNGAPLVRRSPALNAPVGNVGDTSVPVNTHAEDTRLAPAVLENLASVILIVDMRSLQHLKVGQLADYVGMVGLGRLDASA